MSGLLFNLKDQRNVGLKKCSHFKFQKLIRLNKFPFKSQVIGDLQ